MLNNTFQKQINSDSRELIESSLFIQDYTKMKREQGMLSARGAREISNWLLGGDYPNLGYTLSNSSKVGNYHDFAVLLTPIPQRKKFTIKTIKEYKKFGIPVIVLLQTYQELNWFVSNLSEELIDLPHTVVYFSGFGADISHKRELGSVIAYKHGVKYLIHHDSDIELSSSVFEFVTKARRLFKHEDVGVVSFPVKLKTNDGIYRDFKPKQWEMLKDSDEIGATKSNYGTSGCFLIHKLESTAKIWNQGGMVFSWVRGLYGEWVPFSGLLRTMGSNAYYPLEDDLFSINVPDDYNSDPLLSEISSQKAARVLISGLQTLYEFGADFFEIEKFLQSSGTNSMNLDSKALELFWDHWQTRYLSTKVFERIDQNKMKQVFDVSYKEFIRRLPIASQQNKAIDKYCELENKEKILPLSPFD